MAAALCPQQCCLRGDPASGRRGKAKAGAGLCRASRDHLQHLPPVLSSSRALLVSLPGQHRKSGGKASQQRQTSVATACWRGRHYWPEHQHSGSSAADAGGNGQGLEPVLALSRWIAGGDFRCEKGCLWVKCLLPCMAQAHRLAHSSSRRLMCVFA